MSLFCRHKWVERKESERLGCNPNATEVIRAYKYCVKCKEREDIGIVKVIDHSDVMPA